MSGPEDRSSLAILSGPQSGSRVALDAAETLIGSDPRCLVRILSASPIQATVIQDGNGYAILDGGSATGVWVNDDRVVGRTPLRDGDIIWLGAPGDPASSMIQCKLSNATTPPPTGDSDFLVDEPVPEAPGRAAPVEMIEEFVVDPGFDMAPAPPPPSDEVFFVSEGSAPPVAPRVPEPPPAPAEDDGFFVADESPPASWQPSEEPTSFIVDEPVSVPSTEKPTFVQPAPPPPPPRQEPPVVQAPTPPPAPAPPRPAPPASVPTPVQMPRPPQPGSPAPRSPREAPARPPSAPPSRARPQAAPTPSRSGAARAPRRSSTRMPAGYIIAAAGTVLLLVVAAGTANYLFRAPALLAVEPTRARLGETITVSGKNFSSTPAQNEVLFGDMPGQVVEASATQLKVVVPAMRILASEDTPLSVKVRVSGRETAGLSLTVFDAPKIVRIAPDVAMPGDTIEIEGAGWNSQSAAVRVGDASAEIQGTVGNRLSVRVPSLDAAIGASVPVVVVSGSVASAPAMLLIGRLPLVAEVSPVRAQAGDVVHVKGRGFSPEPSADQVRIAGTPALVFAATAVDLQVIVPRTGVSADTPSPLTVQVTGLPNPGEGRLTLAPGPDPVDFKLIAEPFVDAAGHEHAVVGTELGPLFVLSASGAKSAALRASEAAKAWNEAAVRLKASLDEGVEARGLDTGSPVLGLRGRSQALIEVTDEDAAAYNEGWVKATGPPVTRARLAAWWDALARDLVLILIRGHKPERTPALVPEARLLVQLQERAQKTGRFGLPREVLNGMKPAEREALRALALRVPLAVTAASVVAPGVDLTAPKLEGTWNGSEIEGDRTRSITVAFDGRRGSLTYSGGIEVAIPLHGVEQQKGTIRFNAELRGGTRYYVGRWDGQKISGTMNPEGGDARTPLGTFEISQ
jgi:IPT/TIG domain